MKTIQTIKPLIKCAGLKPDTKNAEQFLFLLFSNLIQIEAHQVNQGGWCSLFRIYIYI